MAPDFSSIKPGSPHSAAAAPATAAPSPAAEPGGWTGAFDRIPNWQKYGFVGLFVLTLVVVLVAATVGGGGSTSADTVRTGHGPNEITSGIPHRYDRTQAGAQTAATNFVQAANQVSLGRITAENAKSILVGNEATDALIAVVDESVSQAEGTVMNVLPALVNVTEYSDARAVVSVWAVSASQNDLSGTGKVSVITLWATTTVTLAWEDDDWKAVDWAFRPGPEPEEVSFPEGDSTLAEFGANGLYTFFVE
ncbi:hypothetical protein [Rhodococcus aetherivorans]|uniref:hypothetical protein n=1 Tax=Rhodococcus aetherivorans TaxID=191292 RepID=UPI001639CA7A|nr:hypothetical protein [Rhodococcus aetherivorans]MBC2586927.1 hypothetical protein [Rhodococcus aetherivorans]